MGYRLTNARLIIFLIVIVIICVYFYQTASFESQFESISIISTTVIPNTTTTTITNRRVRKPTLDFAELAQQLRDYAVTRDKDLEKILFPWWLNFKNETNSKRYFNESDPSKGIVICTGNKHFPLTLVALSALQLIENELPIEVMYSTATDLSLENQKELKTRFPTVDLIDLSAATFNDSYLELRGWEIKPFAVLASRYRHVILMDSDVLFLEKPSILLSNSFYLKTGSLFFYDRVDFDGRAIQWIRTLIIDDKKQSIPTRTQESGVVVIDKARTLIGLLSTCKLNDHREREIVTYQRLHGDKDTWWLGYHIVQLSYSFIPTFTGSIGEIVNSGQSNVVCGHILHLDEHSRPIWWNGGTFANRYFDLTLLKIQGWLYEGHWNLAKISCLTNAQDKPKEFNQHQQKLIQGYIQATKQFFHLTK